MKKCLAFLPLIVVLMSCNKNDTTTTYSMTYITDSIKNLAFKPGSYWVYQSASSASRDCTYITNTVAAFYEVANGPNRIALIECYAMECKSVFPGGSAANKYFIETNHMLLNPVIQSPYALGPVLYTFDTLTDWKRTTSVNRYFDSIQAGSKTFYKVQECKFSTDTGAYGYYTVSGIGIVKKVITIDNVAKTWNLVKWKTVK